MTVTDLFQEFKRLVESEELFLYEHLNNAPIFLRFRAEYGIHLHEQDEPFLLELLHDETWKWFVPQLLQVMETFSLKLMEPMIGTAIAVNEPSLCNNFIAPCLRVFDAFLIQEWVLNVVEIGTRTEKIGALKTLYWIRPHILTRFWGKRFKKEETLGYIPTWSEKHQSYEWLRDLKKMSKAEFEAYQLRADALREERRARLLNVFFTEMDPVIRSLTALNLPKTLEEFPTQLRRKAMEFLALKGALQMD
jgi:hypothetical protein